MKTSYISYQDTKPGTAEGIATSHLSMFGSTNKIPLSKNLPELTERVQKIAERLERNRIDIEELNSQLLNKDPNTYINLFGKHEEVRSKIRFKFMIRSCQLRSFQKAVRELTFVS